MKTNCFGRTSKPETIARHAAKMKAERAKGTARLIARLREKVAEHGADSIWAEMLATHGG